MRGTRKQLLFGLTEPTLIGTITILIATVALFVALQAQLGLPFIPTYHVSAQVPDAAQLAINADVRIGGARVGRVVELEAVPGRGDRPAYAELELKLDEGQELPKDTAVTVRPLSILGGKYLALTPGRSPDHIPAGGTIPLRQAQRQTELFEAFNVFDSDTQVGLRGAITSLGEALAGRGTSLNDTLVAARRLMPPLQRVTRMLASPRTELGGFVRGAAATTGALASASGELGTLVDNGATTLEAIDAAGDSLGQTIDRLAPTEIVATRALRRATPVLADAAALTRDIRPGTRLLPLASRRLARAVEVTTPVLGRAPQVLDPMRTTLAAVNAASSAASSSGALDKLLATVSALGDTLRDLTPAQVTCNRGGIFTRNVPSAISQGDAAGTWITLIGIVQSGQDLQSPTPAPNLHVNPDPNESATECESGNEPFSPGQQIGNPAGNQPAATQSTSPPPGVRERAVQAGVIEGEGP